MASQGGNTNEAQCRSSCALDTQFWIKRRHKYDQQKVLSKDRTINYFCDKLLSKCYQMFSNNCFTFNEYYTVTVGIKASSYIYKSSTVYSVFVPVDDRVYAVVMKALNKEGDSVGLWRRADENCRSNSTYYMKDQYVTVLEAQWQSPESENITEPPHSMHQEMKDQTVAICKTNGPIPLTVWSPDPSYTCTP
ncbi:hypothetical protein P7K49_020823 [Saguinus oedipus]|uniref:Placenta-expressed transcript 1 protein n=1 Tax=Saguinus oedipus TaxID=9490 RepID=A0ABQ9URN0_SAGOE|nr:hypothetical protein P7K49_020823 [Saguinus oedipus]